MHALNFKKYFFVVKAKGNMKHFHRKFEEDPLKYFLRALGSSDPRVGNGSRWLLHCQV